MKAAIVINEQLNSGLLANAAACITSGLFSGEQNILGDGIEGNGVIFIPITKIAILILKQNKKPWEELVARAKKNKLKYMLLTEEAQSTTNYGEYIQRVQGKSIEELTVIGIGVLGEDNVVQKFSGDLGLLR